MAITESPVAQRCSRHQKFPDQMVCLDCLKELAERRATLEEALKSAPQLVQELFAEGRRYLEALREIDTVLSTKEVPPGDEDDHDLLAAIVETALDGAEGRILSRPGNPIIAPVAPVANPTGPSAFAKKLGIKN